MDRSPTGTRPNIDCLAGTSINAIRVIAVTIADSSLYEDSQRTGSGAKVQKVEGCSSVRTFRHDEVQLVLRDGQSRSSPRQQTKSPAR